MKRLLAVVATLFLAGFTVFPVAHAKDATPEEILKGVAPSMVRVEMDLQYDKGEPPTGVTDHDPGSQSQPVHSLAEVVGEERPLETTGFLIAPDLVVAMDAPIHPRFVKTIHIRVAGGETTATIESYARDHWAVFLRLAKPLPGTSPIQFKPGKPTLLATQYRMEGSMIRELLPFPGRLQQTEDARIWRIAENQGLAVTSEGQPVGLILSRKLPADDSWQVSPERWARIPLAEYRSTLERLGVASRSTLIRARLSFRSPKATPGQNRRRFRMEADEDDDDSEATERDVLAVVMPGNRVVVLTALRPVSTARLERITLNPDQGGPVNAKFVGSLKDFGGFVVEPERPLNGAPVATAPLSALVEKLCYRADVVLQGENRVEYGHHGRIGTLRTGARLEPYPELPDNSDAERAFLFTPELQLAALPISRREAAGRHTPRMGGHGGPELTSAALLAKAVAGMPGTSDPANVPVAEGEENRLAWLGTELQPMTRELARANNVSEHTQDGETGALVTYVHPGSPAAEAGLTPGAVLLRLRVQGEPLPVEIHLEEDMMRSQPFPWERLDDVREQFFDRLPTPWAPAENAFTRALTDLGFGRSFTLEYISDAKLASKDLKVVAGPTHYESAARYKSEAVGLTVRDLTYDVRRYTQRKSEEPGVVVSKIEAGGKASVAGVKPFELVTHVNDQAVANVKDFERLTAAGGELRLSLKRMAKGRIVTVRLEK
jgi:serine protease Do